MTLHAGLERLPMHYLDWTRMIMAIASLFSLKWEITRIPSRLSALSGLLMVMVKVQKLWKALVEILASMN